MPVHTDVFEHEFQLIIIIIILKIIIIIVLFEPEGFSKCSNIITPGQWAI